MIVGRSCRGACSFFPSAMIAGRGRRHCVTLRRRFRRTRHRPFSLGHEARRGVRSGLHRTFILLILQPTATVADGARGRRSSCVQRRPANGMLSSRGRALRARLPPDAFVVWTQTTKASGGSTAVPSLLPSLACDVPQVVARARGGHRFVRHPPCGRFSAAPRWGCVAIPRGPSLNRSESSFGDGRSMSSAGCGHTRFGVIAGAGAVARSSHVGDGVIRGPVPCGRAIRARGPRPRRRRRLAACGDVRTMGARRRTFRLGEAVDVVGRRRSRRHPGVMAERRMRVRTGASRRHEGCSAGGAAPSKKRRSAMTRVAHASSPSPHLRQVRLVRRGRRPARRRVRLRMQPWSG